MHQGKDLASHSIMSVESRNIQFPVLSSTPSMDEKAKQKLLASTPQLRNVLLGQKTAETEAEEKQRNVRFAMSPKTPISLVEVDHTAAKFGSRISG